MGRHGKNLNRNKLVEKYSINKNRYYNRDKIFKEKWKGVIMINLEKAEKNFKDYLKDYDLNNGNIKLKIKHTYEVMKKSEYISKGLNLNKEDIDLSKLIALLHDIGRFEQVKQTNDFIDSTGFEHANYGVKVLFEEREGEYMKGHTTNYIMVKEKTEENLENKIVEVEFKF